MQAFKKALAKETQMGSLTSDESVLAPIISVTAQLK